MAVTSGPLAGAHGKAPSPVEQMWIAAAQELTPDKSLQRIQDSAKQLFTSVAAVTALITGFGLISGANLRANPALLILAIALTALSLVLAMASLIVNPQKVRITSIESVRDYYEHDLLWKGRFIQFGGISFALALLFAAAAAVTGAAPAATVSPITSAHWSGTTRSSTLMVSTVIAGAPPGATVSLVVLSGQGEPPKQLLADKTRTDGNGDASLSDTLPVAGLDQAELQVIVENNGKDVQTDEVQVSRTG